MLKCYDLLDDKSRRLHQAVYVMPYMSRCRAFL